jgi:hypothetical protein
MRESSLVRGNTGGPPVQLYKLISNTSMISQKGLVPFLTGQLICKGVWYNGADPHGARLRVQVAITLEIDCLRMAAFLCR